MLFDSLQALSDAHADSMKARDYEGALERLASLREPVDAFFDDVMVMTDDESLTINRLALLGQLRNLFLDVADISRLSIA